VDATFEGIHGFPNQRMSGIRMTGMYVRITFLDGPKTLMAFEVRHSDDGAIEAAVQLRESFFRRSGNFRVGTRKS
jgi:hypothetical protein